MTLHNPLRAIGALRFEPKSGNLDDYPTPPWATRALFKYLIGDHFQRSSCFEPACGRLYMVQVLKDYFKSVRASDVADYGDNVVQDYFQLASTDVIVDWIITNPPFNEASAFIRKSLEIAEVGVAVFTRIAFLEGIGRYERLFLNTPPQIVGVFTERVHLAKGYVSANSGSTICYCWMIWNKNHSCKEGTKLQWIPPCRKLLEKSTDYNQLGDIP